MLKKIWQRSAATIMFSAGIYYMQNITRATVCQQTKTQLSFSELPPCFLFVFFTWVRNIPAHLDEDPHVLQVFPMPLVKGLQQLQTVTGGVYIHLYDIKTGLDINLFP